MKRLLTACALAALCACSKPMQEQAKAAPAPAAAAPAPAPAPAAPQPPAGTYSVDPAHTTLVFRLSHLGFSKYTGQFTTVGGTLKFDPKAPQAMSIEAKVDPKSLSIPSPPPGFRDTLLGPQWLDAGRFPTITFRSTAVDVTGPNTATVTGDFTLHGVTKPLTLQATYNGGWPPMSMDPGGRIGFSAKGVLKRSDYGISYGIPAPGSNMGVGDEVEIAIEAEFSQAAPAPAPKTPAAKK